MRTKVFLWALVGCLVAPSIATAQDIYFSMGNEIRKIAGSGSPSLVHTAARQVRDLTLCAGDPDATPISAGRQYLYLWSTMRSVAIRISRLDINTALGKKASVNTSWQQIFPADPADGFGGTIGEIRLTPTCNVVFASRRACFGERPPGFYGVERRAVGECFNRLRAGNRIRWNFEILGSIHANGHRRSRCREWWRGVG